MTYLAVSAGFSLGLERAGMETVAFCEIEDYPVSILNKHWPDVPVYRDIRNLHCDEFGNLFEVDENGDVWVND